MRKIEKKTWASYFQEILDGNKTFDLRLNDFKIEMGDILVLREYDPKTKTYTGRSVEKRVGYIGRWTIDELARFSSREEMEQKGIQVISLKD